MPAISVIVPVYQAESLLPQCVESVLSQTFFRLGTAAGGGLRPGPQQGDHRTIYSENRRYENPHADLLCESGGGEST